MSFDLGRLMRETESLDKEAAAWLDRAAGTDQYDVVIKALDKLCDAPFPLDIIAALATIQIAHLIEMKERAQG